MNQRQYRPLLRLLTVLLLVMAIALSGTGHADRFIGRAGMDRLSAANSRYLDASFDRALKGFLVLSALKMGLAVIKDSEAGISIGISTQLHIGGLVQSAYDYVDVAWKVLLVGTSVLLGLQYILKCVALIDGPALTATLSLLLVMLLLRWFLPSARRTCRMAHDAAVFSLIITLSLYLAVPLSVSGAAMLSSAITAPSVAEAEKGVEAMKKELFPDGGMPEGGLLDRLQGAKERIEETARQLRLKARELSIWVVKIITGYLFDCIVFPLVLFYALYRFMRGTVLYLTALNRETETREMIASLLAEQAATMHRPSSDQLKPEPGESDAVKPS